MLRLFPSLQILQQTWLREPVFENLSLQVVWTRKDTHFMYWESGCIRKVNGVPSNYIYSMNVFSIYTCKYSTMMLTKIYQIPKFIYIHIIISWYKEHRITLSLLSIFIHENLILHNLIITIGTEHVSIIRLHETFICFKTMIICGAKRVNNFQMTEKIAKYERSDDTSQFIR